MKNSSDVTFQIAIDANIMSCLDLRKRLEALISKSHTDILLEIRKPEIRTRGIDPTILVATVGAIGAGLGALITGLLKIAQGSSAKRIIIQSRKGARIEFPADMKSDQIDVLIDKLIKLDADKIIIS
ncbi:MAG TPA: hypothetical protein DDW27_03745 [Bacteroidales bacterium]|nr:hypothetical protein [Bacteroidales bacterium]